MGMKAYVLAIGGFSEEVKHILDYPEEHYEGTRTGAVVTRHFFNCGSSQASNELAEALYVDPLDFNTHHIINPEAVNFDRLIVLSDHAEWDEDDIYAFVDLARIGRFFFLFLPNS
jgi:hypothetical protein